MSLIIKGKQYNLPKNCVRCLFHKSEYDRIVCLFSGEAINFLEKEGERIKKNCVIEDFDKFQKSTISEKTVSEILALASSRASTMDINCLDHTQREEKAITLGELKKILAEVSSCG